MRIDVARVLRRTLSALASVGIAFSVSGCNLSVSRSEITPDSEKFQALGGGKLGCLNGMADLIYRYWEGASSKDEVEEKWSCAESAITLFVERTHGKNAGYYTPEELRDFLQKFFIRDFTLSDALMNEAMEFKSSVLGGRPDRLGKAELKQLLKLLTELHKQSILVQPFLPLTPKRFEMASDAQVAQVTEALVTAGKRVGDVLEEQTVSYPFERLDAFLDEISKIYPGSGPREFMKRLPLAVAVKHVLISPRLVTTRDGRQVDGLSGRDATRAFEMAARAYSVLLRIAQIRGDDSSIFAGAGRERLVLAADDIFNLISDSIAQHPQAVIPFSEFETLFALLEKGDLGALQPETLRGLVKPVLCKLVQGDPGCANPNSIGLDGNGIGRLRSLFHLWNEGQVFLETLYSQLAPGAELTSDLLSTNLQPQALFDASSPSAFNLGRPTVELSHISAQAISEIRPMFKAYTPMFSKPDGRVFFNDWGTERGHTMDDLSQMNWMRQIVRLLIQGYGMDPKRVANLDGVTLGEFRGLIKDITPLLLDFKVVDPAQKKLDEKRFREASLFTYASDGNELLDVNEGTMYLAEVLSASKLAATIYKDMSDPKIGACAVNEIDAYGRFYLDENCFRREFFKRFDQYADHMPTMQKYYKSLNPGEQKNFKMLMERSSRQDDGSRPVMVSYIAEGSASVMQYVETIFSKFDVHHYGYLDPEAGAKAFPVFRETLAGFADQTNPKIVEAIFTYLLTFGKAPDMNECGKVTIAGGASIMPTLGLATTNKTWNYQADRGRLMEIFAELTRLTGQKKPASCQSR